jgi:hypothetical protein
LKPLYLVIYHRECYKTLLRNILYDFQ